MESAGTLVPLHGVIVEPRIAEIRERGGEPRVSAGLPVEARVWAGLQIETGMTAGTEAGLGGPGRDGCGCPEIGLVACTEMRVSV